MYRVVIADTDAENSKNFRNYMANNFPDFKICKVISDPFADIESELAVEMPDLLLSDARYFRVSGLRVLKILEENKGPKILLYGIYHDEDYMRKALDHGVLDYCIKPIKPSELNRILNTAVEHFKMEERLKEENNTIFEVYKAKRKLFMELFLTNLLEGNISNEAEIKESMSYFQLELKPPYCVLVIRIDHFKKLILALDDEEKHMLTMKVFTLAKRKFGHLQNIVFFNIFNAVIIILSAQAPGKAAGHRLELNAIVELSESLKTELNDKAKIKVTVGIGRTYEKLSELATSYKEANNALRYRFRMGYNTVIPIQYVESQKNISYIYPFDKEERLIYATVIGQYEYCQGLLKDIFGTMQRAEPLPDKLLPKIIMSILISISRYLSEQNLPGQELFTTYFPTKDVFNLKSLEEAYSFLETAMEGFCRHMVEVHDEKNKVLYERIKAYVGERYFETFSITKIAMQVNTTPEYANKLFLDRESKTLFDYVVMVRMENAKTLMRETDYDDDFISVKIGYDDARYFRSVFRQHEGLTTTEYRSKVKLMSLNNN